MIKDKNKRIYIDIFFKAITYSYKFIYEKK